MAQVSISNELIKLYPSKFRMTDNNGFERFYDGRWLRWEDYLKAVANNHNGMLGRSPNN